MVSFTRMKEDLDELTTQVKLLILKFIFQNSFFDTFPLSPGRNKITRQDSLVAFGGNMYLDNFYSRFWDWLRIWEKHRQYLKTTILLFYLQQQ